MNNTRTHPNWCAANSVEFREDARPKASTDDTRQRPWGTSWISSLGAIMLAVLLPTGTASAQSQEQGQSAGGSPGQRLTILDQDEAERVAGEWGIRLRGETSQGRVFELQRIVNGMPFYYITHNLDAADSLSTDECWPGGSTGYGLTGAGVRLGIWDGGGTRTTHIEFSGRATQIEPFSMLSSHATHVAGTMIGEGLWPGGFGYPVGQSRGGAHEATLDCYDWNNDLNEMDLAAQQGLPVSNHSYGLITGWVEDNFGAGWGWYWFGDVTVSQEEDYYFGFYSDESVAWDQTTYDNPHYLFVTSAGNDRNEGPSAGTSHWYWDDGTEDWVTSSTTRNKDGNSGYDCIGHAGISKNGLTVGAVNDVVGGYSDPRDVSMTSFSCWGPADDGRIKPDIVGNGLWLFSAYHNPDYPGEDNWYAEYSGTSMASPNVTGSLGLLLEHYRGTHPGIPDLLAASLKGLAIHTADECGSNPGPDYEFGWGLMNTAKAAALISKDTLQSLTISEWTLSDSDAVLLAVTTSKGSDELRATICWTDPPGTPPAAAVDPTTKMLVNDLDMRITSSDGAVVYAPWVLDVGNPTAAATTGDNDVDNVEQIVIEAPGANVFFLQVTSKGPLAGGEQRVSLIISGASSITSDCNDNGINDLTDISSGTSQDCNGNSFPDECDIVAGVSADCNGNDKPDECDISSGLEEDCNVDFIPDSCLPPITVNLGPDRELAPNRTHVTLAPLFSIQGGVGTLSYFWEIVSGPSSSGIDNASALEPAFTPPAVGTYVVRCTVTDSSPGPCSHSDEFTIHVADLVANVTNDMAACLDFDTLPLGGSPTASGGTSPLIYAWSVIDGPSDFDSFSSTISNPTLLPPAKEDYDVQVVITDSSDPPYTVTEMVHISVGDGPTVSAGTAETYHPIIMVGAELPLGGSPTGSGGTLPYSYGWSIPVNPNDGGTISDVTAANPTFSATEIGAYVIRLQLTDASGCPAETRFTVSVVKDPPSSTAPIVPGLNPGQCGTCGATGAASLGTLFICCVVLYSRRRPSRR
ncbi:MAG: S8 family serine peptidase [Planctomycetota bacterium]